MAIPDSIKAFKPTNLGPCEIRYIGGHYYVYSITSKWDPELKRSKKVTLGTLGKITEEDGFVMNKKSVPLPATVVVKEYGVYLLFEKICTSLYNDLKEVFPDLFREIFVISLMRLTHRCAARDLKRIYDSTVLSSLHPGLAMGEASVSSFIKELGQKRPQMIEFMQKYVGNETTLLFDGTNIFTSASGGSYPQKGYNHGKKKATQINLLYVFSADSHKPIYYRMLPGNIVDKASMVSAVKESGIKDAVIIGDKGFYSKTNTSFLDAAGIKYILPLQSNTKYLDNDWVENTDRRKFDGHFIYHDRVIWFKKTSVGENGHYLYIFQDDMLRVNEEKNYLVRQDEDWEGYTMDDFFSQKRNGMMSFIASLDTEAEDIFIKYKSRWEIEECFDYLKNTVKIGACYQRDDTSLEAWAFLNHISLMQFYELNSLLTKLGMKEKYSAEDIIEKCSTIYKVILDNGAEIISETTKDDKELLLKLGVPIT